MQRLLVLAVVAGCGNVQAPATTPDAGSPDASSGVDLARGCIYQAKMDEPSWPTTGKPVLDTCGGDLGAVSGSGAAPASDATRGRVGSFSGTACVDVASSQALHGTTALTMSAWIHPTAIDAAGTTGTSNGILSKRLDKGSQSEYGLFLWTGSHVWIDLGDADRYAGTAVIATNVWTQVVAVFDSSLADADRVRLFVNGTRDPLTHAMIGTLGTTLPIYDAPLHLGCTPAPSAMPATQQTFRGQLDDVTLWNRALTADEIAALNAK